MSKSKNSRAGKASKQTKQLMGGGVLVIVAAIVAAVLMLHLHQPAAQDNSQTASSNTATTKPISQDNTQPVQPATQYLVIKEWGVELPLSPAIKDAYYVVGTASMKDPDGLPSTVFLGLRSINDSSCNPASNNAGGDGAVGAILRVPADYSDPVSPHQPYTQKYPNGVIIGKYYYAYQSWVNDNNCVQQATYESINSVFATAANSISQVESNNH